VTKVNKYLVLSDMTLSAIQAEATRAHIRHGKNSMLNAHYGDAQRLAILTEEVGEVAHEMNELMLGNIERSEYKDKIEKELIQVAAMAATWIEALNNNIK
jgi:NTP pyrophosphatase (non-canonical NTP hydrolase)